MAVALRHDAARAERRQAVLERAGRAPFVVVTPRRRVAWFAITLSVLVSTAMLGAVLLHTRIAERQRHIDTLEQGVRDAYAQFDVLRASRAELRAPTRVATGAAALGMVPGSESRFVDVDPMTLAIAIATSGRVPAGDAIVVGSTDRLEPLQQFQLVKQVAAEAP
ncbi:MAG TPA: hypothetical protein VNQ73_06185 [Ilumatobacter sp.]|nr:hypothetical protein [Ilumatobacter sp.]